MILYIGLGGIFLNEDNNNTFNSKVYKQKSLRDLEKFSISLDETTDNVDLKKKVWTWRILMIFIDTSFLISILIKTNIHHEKALI